MQAQIKALEAALNQDLVVIQGPPGTGKTFLGVKIILTLLANGVGPAAPTYFARLRGDVGLAPKAITAASGPVLCLCYTNHALVSQNLKLQYQVPN